MFRAAYGVTGGPTFEDKAYVLKMPTPLAEVAPDAEDDRGANCCAKLAPLKAKLLEARAKRQAAVPRHEGPDRLERADDRRPRGRRPDIQGARVHEGRDKSRRLRARRICEPRTAGSCGPTATSRRRQGRKRKSTPTSTTTPSSSTACSRLHDATGEDRWLKEAKALTDTMVKWSRRRQSRGGFFYTASDGEKLFARAKDHYDGVQPSGNSVMARNLVRLWRKTGDETTASWPRRRSSSSPAC